MMLERKGPGLDRSRARAPRRPRTAGAAWLVLTALALSAPASAAPPWSAPITISGPNAAGAAPEEAQIAVDRAGGALVIWQEAFPAARHDAPRVLASYRPPGGRFGRPRAISPGRAAATRPRVALDGAGNATVVWEVDELRSNLGQAVGSVVAAVRPAGGRFGAPQRLSARSQRAARPDIAVDEAGNAVVVWQRRVEPPGGYRFTPAAYEVQAAVRSGRGRFGPPQTLSGRSLPVSRGPASTPVPLEMDPVAAIDTAGGEAIALWTRADGTSRTCCTREEAAARAPGEAFARPTALSEATEFGAVAGHDLELDRTGRALALWSRFDGATEDCCYRIEAAVRPPSEAFQAPRILSGPGRRMGFGPAGALAADGEAVAVWGSDEPGEDGGGCIRGRIEGSASPPGGGFTAPQVLSAAHRSTSGPELAMDADGNSVAVWARVTREAFNERGDCAPASFRIESAARPAGGAFGEPAAISSPAAGRGDVPRIAPGPGSTVIAVWIDGRVRAAGYRTSLGRDPHPDVTRPVIRRFSVRPSRFRVASARTARGGATISFELSERARVTIGLFRRSGRGSNQFERVGSLVRTGRRGRNRFRFSGRVGRRYLRPGRYVAEIAAVDRGGNESGFPPTASFAVLR